MWIITRLDWFAGLGSESDIPEPTPLHWCYTLNLLSEEITIILIVSYAYEREISTHTTFIIFISLYISHLLYFLLLFSCLSRCENSLVLDDELNILPISSDQSENQDRGDVLDKISTAQMKETKELNALVQSLADTQPSGALVALCKTLDQVSKYFTLSLLSLTYTFSLLLYYVLFIHTHRREKTLIHKRG